MTGSESLIEPQAAPTPPLLAELTEEIDHTLREWIDERPIPENLRQAVRYVSLAGGKRLRPVLSLLCCQAVGAERGLALPAACAVELVHTFSLTHDDLPAMDDDDLRRGRPTLHKHTSEAMAVLAGDALLGQAFELIALRVESPGLARELVVELARGTGDMISGQVWDTLPEFDESVPPRTRLLTIHRHKTGALLRAACRMGALSGQASPHQLDAITRYSEACGLMFQIVDDLLDVTQTTSHLGKTAGKDAEQGKLTFPGLLGIEASQKEVERSRSAAHEALDRLGSSQREAVLPLRELCDWMAVRTR
jgi:geranylgeranyl pyrophosphate synthase